MTISQLISIYVVIGAICLFVLFALQLARGFFRTPVDGRLDVQFKFSQKYRWFLFSVILLAPIGLANLVSDWLEILGSVEQTNAISFMYLFIVLVWIIKLQIQMNRLKLK